MMEVTESAYPTFEHLKQNYNDRLDRVRWRSKQVVDYAFMFHTGSVLTKQYYMQIEDDVISTMGLYTKILQGIEQKSRKTHWVTLEFTTFGFVGKLYKAQHLEQFAAYLMIFYQEQPVDWLAGYFSKLLTQKDRIKLTPSLFQHFGLHSTFQSNYQKVMDKTFRDADPLDLAEVTLAQGKSQSKTLRSANQVYDMGKSSNSKGKVVESPNPKATLHTTLKTYQSHSPDLAYNGGGNFFWSTLPQINDTYTIAFVEPIVLKSLSISTGHVKHPGDYARSGVVEYSHVPLLKDSFNHTLTSKGYKDYKLLRELDESGCLSIRNLTISQPVSCVRLRLTQEQKEWLVIHSIRINGP